MKVKIPSKIRVGAYDYSVLAIPNLTFDFRLLGQSLADKQVIKVEPDTTSQTKNVTLWHEIIHAISDVYNCELDEKNIDRIAQGIASIIDKDLQIEFDWDEIDGNTSNSKPT